ncbi:hypothetical protein TKK_0002469 [Trichogramma kaykai]|uniref:Histone-lysine N-methyltransferase SETMAR n=1 Tax=Trichogramma kaykai TaxID=54128 RepID=A0ABD2VXF4_9HYME
MVSIVASYGADNYEHLLPDVMYVVSNIPGPGSELDDFETTFALGCSCEQECKENSCSCIHGTQNYINNKLSNASKNVLTECNSICTCNEKCGNRLVQQGPLDCLVIKETIVKNIGFGLFTSKLIRKGQFICEYAGEVIGIEEAYKRFDENKVKEQMNYVLVVTEHIGEKKITTCIDPAKFGNIGRYANHSCEPNAMLVPVRIDLVIPRLCLFAIKDIESMEEITFNYAGVTIDSVHSSSGTPCLCGAAACTGYLPHCPI